MLRCMSCVAAGRGKLCGYAVGKGRRPSFGPVPSQTRAPDGRSGEVDGGGGTDVVDVGEMSVRL